MTEDSQSGVRGYGPFQEGAEPTGQRPTPNADETRIPVQRARAVDEPEAASARQPASASGDPHPASSHPAYGGDAQPVIGQPGYGGDPHPASAHPGYGSDPQPVSGQPGYGPGSHPTSSHPGYGGDQLPTSGHPGHDPGSHPTSSHPGHDSDPLPTSGHPGYASHPGHPQPISAQPTYGTDPRIGHPLYGAPYAAADPAASGTRPPAGTPDGFEQPISRTPHPGPDPDPDPYGFSAPPGRRIEPSPPPDRNRLIFGVLAGLVAGLVLFGTAGWFVGRATAPKSAAPTSAPTATPGRLGVFEQNQVTVNRPDFAGTGLTPLAEGWLPYLATCTRNNTPGGPALNPGEKFRVRCTLDGMSAIFVEYTSTAERDKARVKALGQAVDARSLTPGVAPASERATPSGRTAGNYVEYAYRLTERGTTRTVSGLWWDDAQTPVAGYLLAYWKDGVGESWEPMRDLWSRYA